LQRVSGKASEAIPRGGRLAFGEIIRSNEVEGMFTLEDGSRIEMRPRSEVSLEPGGDGVRIRLNRGTVIVTAAKQRSGHLYVQTKDVTVSVVGTVFLVNAEEEGSRVAVIQGEVHVQEGDRVKKLLAGEQVSTGVSREILPVVQEVSWSPNAALHVAMLQQNTVPPVEPGLEFAAASIKLVGSGGLYARDMLPLGLACRGIDGVKRSPFLNAGLIVAPQGRCVGSGVLLYDLVGMAYGLPPRNVLGGPDWAGTSIFSVTQAFKIEATADDPSTVTSEQLKQMLRTLLADRFKVKVHREKQESPGYGLLVAQGGLKLKEVFSDTESPHPDFSDHATTTRGRSTMDELAKWLTTELAIPVVNKTGLTGVYEYEFRHPTPEFGHRGSGQSPQALLPVRPDNAPAYSGALESQMGLRLEAGKVPFETLVIEQAEKPEPN